VEAWKIDKSQGWFILGRGRLEERMGNTAWARPQDNKLTENTQTLNNYIHSTGKLAFS